MGHAADKISSYQHNTYYDETSDDPEVIRMQIEQTRAEMSRTVNTIQERLSPERLTRQAKDSIKEAAKGKVEEMTDIATRKARNWRASVVETVKQNPIPAALIGIGVGWLLMEGKNDSSAGKAYNYPYGSDVYKYYDTSPEHNKAYSREVQHTPAESGLRGKSREIAGNIQDRTGEVADNVQAKAGEVVGNVQDKASQVAGNVQEKAGEVADQAKAQVGYVSDQAPQQAAYLKDQAYYQAQQAKQGFQHTLQENPLAVGAMAVAAGAVVGLLIPSTRKEDELMGETRDRLVHQAQATAQDKFEKAQRVAEKAQQAATETAKEEAEKQNLTG